MKVHSETKLSQFKFWAGATQRVKYLTWEQLDTIEEILNDLYPNGIKATELNDLFWFDEDTIAEWLGYDSFDKLIPPWD